MGSGDCGGGELCGAGDVSADGDRRAGGVLTVYGNVAGGQATAALAGDGLTAAAVVVESDCGYLSGDKRGCNECGAEYYGLEYRRGDGERCRRRW